MTEKALADIVTQARERWELQRVTLIHRVGSLYPNDEIVFVGVSAAHRGMAFEAAEFLMDYLKTRAPFWKKRHCRKAAPAGWMPEKATRKPQIAGNLPLITS